MASGVRWRNTDEVAASRVSAVIKRTAAVADIVVISRPRFHHRLPIHRRRDPARWLRAGEQPSMRGADGYMRVSY